MTIRQEQLGNITELDKNNSGSIDANNSRIINVGTPINNNDVATKNYVDTYGGGGGSQSLSQVLSVGNTTGDNNIIISDGYKIISEADLLIEVPDGYSAFVNKSLKIGDNTNFVNINYDTGSDAIMYNHTSSIVFGFNDFGNYPSTYAKEISITSQSNSGLDGTGGGIYITSGDSLSGDGHGGVIGIWAGQGSGTGTSGDITFYVNPSGIDGYAGSINFRLNKGDSNPGKLSIITEDPINGVIEKFSVSEIGVNILQDPVLNNNATHKKYVDELASFDGSHLSMSSNQRNLQAGGYERSWEMINTGMTDTNINSSPAGSDLVASTRGIHLVGTLGGLQGQHYSMSFSGLEFGKDFDFTNDVSPSKGNACAFIGYSINANFFNTWNIASNGIVSNYVYDSSHSAEFDSNVDETSGGADWSGARAAFLYKENNFISGIVSVTYWTAPNENKVYSETAFFEGLQNTAFSNSPKAICADKDGYLWVSFDNNELIQFSTGNTSLDYGVLTEIKKLQNIPLLIDMVFDGTCIWGVSLDGTYGKVLKINPVTKNIKEYSAASVGLKFHARSRVLFDNGFIYISAQGRIYKFNINNNSGELYPLSIITTELGEVRGLAADKDNNIYSAVMSSSTNTIWICKYYSKLDGNCPTIEEFNNTYVLKSSPTSTYTPSPFNFINLTGTTGDTRKFSETFSLEITITAGRHSMYGHGLRAMWKKFYLVNYTGTMNIIHSADILSVYKDSVALSEGWDFTLTTSGSNLNGVLTHGTNTGLTVWNVNIKIMMNNKDLA
jgi:hypothetical protein